MAKKKNEGAVKKIIKEGLQGIYIFPFEKALACVKADKPIAGYYLMPGSSGIGEAGIGDFLICMMGNYIEVETKTTKGKASGIQNAHASVISAAGGQPYLVKGEEEAKNFIKFLAGELNKMLEVEAIASKVRDDFQGVIADLNKKDPNEKIH